MDSSTVLIIAIPALLVLAAIAIVAEGWRRRSNTGRLSRETRKRDRSMPEGEPPVPATVGTGLAELDDEARARADESRQALEPVGARAPVEYVPVDDEELGLTRRQFFNRGILAGLGIFAAGMGAAMLGFLWPSSAGGFGSKIVVGSEDDAKQQFDKKLPFYNAAARTYIQPYPKEDIPKAKKVYDPRIVAGMEKGYVALYQKCVHLGCRVPWCESSQWFECPCHGSKYNRVGEKKGGPAPRGLDRFVLEVSGGEITVDTAASSLVQGPPIGTDTTGQTAEGAPCV
ncbi:MAG TPA: ubiquinol-cytochrome c reductase iron-sulfur subunit [Acidimicrobiia bacterium]|nr:ubiquinol-cytochrome c reductase iron-sulfur subunit [Acidimicrobiia bacterium]